MTDASRGGDSPWGENWPPIDDELWPTGTEVEAALVEVSKLCAGSGWEVPSRHEIGVILCAAAHARRALGV